MNPIPLEIKPFKRDPKQAQMIQGPGSPSPDPSRPLRAGPISAGGTWQGAGLAWIGVAAGNQVEEFDLA
jgi:hypothetical protein